MSKRTAWYRSLQAHVVLIQLCDNELRRDCGIPMVWYDVLVKLWLAPEQSLRMSELADQALLSRSWLTRRVIQLEQAGLVERTSADGDRRGVRATMTEKGKQVFLDWGAVALPLHRAAFLPPPQQRRSHRDCRRFRPYRSGGQTIAGRIGTHRRHRIKIVSGRFRPQ